MPRMIPEIENRSAVQKSEAAGEAQLIRLYSIAGPARDILTSVSYHRRTVIKPHCCCKLKFSRTTLQVPVCASQLMAEQTDFQLAASLSSCLHPRKVWPLTENVYQSWLFTFLCYPLGSRLCGNSSCKTREQISVEIFRRMFHTDHVNVEPVQVQELLDQIP